MRLFNVMKMNKPFASAVQLSSQISEITSVLLLLARDTGSADLRAPTYLIHLWKI